MVGKLRRCCRLKVLRHYSIFMIKIVKMHWRARKFIPESHHWSICQPSKDLRGISNWFRRCTYCSAMGCAYSGQKQFRRIPCPKVPANFTVRHASHSL